MDEVVLTKLEEKKGILALALMIFFIIKPEFFSNAGGQYVKYMMTVFQLLVYAYILFVWIRNRRTSSFLILTALMYGLIILSTILNGGSLTEAIKLGAVNIILIMLLENEIDRIDYLMKAFIICLSILVVANFIAILLFPDGLYMGTYTYNGKVLPGQMSWILSVNNGMGKYFLYLLFFKAEYDLKKYDRIRPSFYFLSLICISSVIITGSLTSVLGVGVMVVMIAMSQLINKMKPGIYNIYLFLGVIVIFHVLFVVLQNVGIFSGFVTNVLGDSLTFSGRTNIWTAVLKRIPLKPVLGFGFISQSDFRYFTGMPVASDSHNYLLHLTAFGGLVTALLFVVIIIMASRTIRSRQFDYSGITLTAFMFTFFLIMLFENTTNKLYWTIFAYAFYLNYKPQDTDPALGARDILGWSIYV